jgi:hypothetical protein
MVLEMPLELRKTIPLTEFPHHDNFHLGALCVDTYLNVMCDKRDLLNCHLHHTLSHTCLSTRTTVDVYQTESRLTPFPRQNFEYRDDFRRTYPHE